MKFSDITSMLQARFEQAIRLLPPTSHFSMGSRTQKTRLHKLSTQMGLRALLFSRRLTGLANGTSYTFKVTATNEATGVKFETVSGSDGGYLFPQLPVGTYTIAVSAPGFKSYTAKGILLNIDQEYVAPIKLAVGSTAEVIEVAASPVQVDTTDSQLSNVINSEQMVEYPLIGRNFTGLELALPGVC